MKLSLPPLIKYVLIGLALTGVLVGIAYWTNTGSQVRLEGSILKVRTVATDDAASIAVVDFRVTNPARALFQLDKVTLVVTGVDGQVAEGEAVAQMDLDRVLEYHKVLGPRYTDVLKERDRIRSGQTLDRTVAGSFAVAEKTLVERRNLVLRLKDADGVVVEIPEHGR